MAQPKPINVVIVGVGLVGERVVHQLDSKHLRKIFKINSLYTSKKSIIVSDDNISYTATSLINELKSNSSNQFKDGLKGILDYVLDPIKLPRPAIVVDCTSNQDLANAYPTILSSVSPIHLVTPNKKAFSGPEELNKSIDQASNEKHNLVFKESTVGAGLPIISTLRELVVTGDEILKVEGVFSGTMSYLFNRFSQPNIPTTTKFSEVVAEAKANGYTEPHPGDDLNGSDVARKLCILARNLSNPISLPNGFQSVPTQSLIPTQLSTVEDPIEFMKELPKFDDEFEKLKDQAFQEGCVLRFVGIINLTSKSTVEVKAGLEKYPFSHPFATLSGSDNIISFSTKRYSPNPLIIQGAGAGADVTAMGVVGDMIKVAERTLGYNI
ncbi:homoserine dehydrogenase-domain-containing protein [Melampsora americana]|nr:homoserine dehydrogenase-domain-containing protein [Melampsora americana]